jgi:hypothetical protein
MAHVARAKFDLHSDDLEMPVRCPILAMPLTFSKKRGGSDGSPTIVRLDEAQGFVRGNVLVVSRAGARALAASRRLSNAVAIATLWLWDQAEVPA